MSKSVNKSLAKSAKAESWKLTGELTLSCNCTVFCPCVLSLGQHPPTEGYCMTWAGVRIDRGYFDDVDLSGINAGLMLEIPGLMSRGNWTAAAFIDERASPPAVEALTRIFTGQAGGTTALLSILVGRFLGVQQVPIRYEVKDDVRHFEIPKLIEGVVSPIPGNKAGEHTTIENSQYWISSKVMVCKAERSKLRVFGRNWNFAGRSAEVCPLDWGNG
ncbi:DUF1326 domain-containing protein [Blastochloris viridis]|uniref:DUF1326 domain-containing protein n=1 Tax=Blastochloris viridis TaxID=1079 RepID=UPI0006D74A57|nr:DUF1326 domain-containing protein [Blastochloris viridis]ALK09573.1 hypothetical protein BVIR_1799 [Blastochloris viridis]